jgi:hypothetical protein
MEKSYQALRKSLDGLMDVINSIKTSPEWLEIINHPGAHPDLITDFAICLADTKDLCLHMDLSLISIQNTATRQTHLLKEVQEEGILIAPLSIRVIGVKRK